jgi:hypothetical protein
MDSNRALKLRMTWWTLYGPGTAQRGQCSPPWEYSGSPGSHEPHGGWSIEYVCLVREATLPCVQSEAKHHDLARITV